MRRGGRMKYICSEAMEYEACVDETAGHKCPHRLPHEKEWSAKGCCTHEESRGCLVSETCICIEEVG